MFHSPSGSPGTEGPEPLPLRGPEWTYYGASSRTASRWGRAARCREEGRRGVGDLCGTGNRVGLDDAARGSGMSRNTRAHCLPGWFISTDPSLGILIKILRLPKFYWVCKINLTPHTNIYIYVHLSSTQRFQDKCV